jgi:hypothetical protein
MSRVRFETESLGCYTVITAGAIKMSEADFVAVIQYGNSIDQIIIKEAIADATRLLIRIPGWRC